MRGLMLKFIFVSLYSFLSKIDIRSRIFQEKILLVSYLRSPACVGFPSHLQPLPTAA